MVLVRKVLTYSAFLVAEVLRKVQHPGIYWRDWGSCQSLKACVRDL